MHSEHESFHGGGPGDRATGSTGGDPAVTWAVDAVVATMANLVFVTTGPAACQTLGVLPEQVALTPIVALRIAEILRACLGSPTPGERSAQVEEWQAAERARIPGGRLVLDASAAHIGIEPLGAGTLVSVLWENVPALIWQLEAVAIPMRAQG